MIVEATRQCLTHLLRKFEESGSASSNNALLNSSLSGIQSVLYPQLLLLQLCFRLCTNLRMHNSMSWVLV